jgi:uncharacterized protein (TIGR02246 family)
MKKNPLTIIILLICSLLQAQDKSKNDAAINKQVDAMINSWNQHNYDDLKNYTTEDTDWVNGVGAWWKGREESQFAHQVYHNTMFKESVLTKTALSIRYVTRDVAVAHLLWHFDGPVTDPAGKKLGPDDCIATLVFVNKNGKWLMTAGENTVVIKEVQQFDPILMRKNKAK